MLRSRLLDAVPNLRHGFSTRQGGVSSAPFDSLNLGLGVGDDPAQVAKNRQIFANSLELKDLSLLLQVEQVHGVKVVSGAECAGQQADAIIEDRIGPAVGVRTADCAPILVAALDSGRAVAVAAIHAGWRGAVDGIVPRTLEALAQWGVRSEQLRVAIGPTIGVDAFEVGPEVIDAARRALGRPPPMQMSARDTPHLDLVAFIEQQLLEHLAPAAMERVGGCTYANAALFFSHRRDRGRTGRHLSAIRMLG